MTEQMTLAGIPFAEVNVDKPIFVNELSGSDDTTSKEICPGCKNKLVENFNANTRALGFMHFCRECWEHVNVKTKEMVY